MTYLAKTFKTEFIENDYDIDVTIDSMGITAKVVDAPWEDSNGDMQESTDITFSDGSTANVHPHDVEIAK